MSDFESLLVTNTPEAQDLARKLRALIFKVLPKAQERIYKGWGVADIYRGEPQGRGFMSIGPQKKYVNLYFMDGVNLPDPDGLLEGSGKRMRHLKILTMNDLNKPALSKLIKKAFDIQ